MKKTNMPSYFNYKCKISMKEKTKRKRKKSKKFNTKKVPVTDNLKTKPAEKERKEEDKKNLTQFSSRESKKRNKRPNHSNYRERSKESSTSRDLRRKTTKTKIFPCKEPKKRKLETSRPRETTADYSMSKKKPVKTN